MKVKLFAMILLFFALQPFIVSASPAGELKNGNFEEWIDSSHLKYWKHNDTAFTISNSTGRSGTGSCVEIVPPISGWSYLNISLGSVSPGQELNATIYAKGNALGLQFAVMVEWFLDNTSQGAPVALISDFASSDESWNFFPCMTPRTVPAGVNNATLIITTAFDRRSRAPGDKLYFDDCIVSGSAIPEIPPSIARMLFFSVSTALLTIIWWRNKNGEICLKKHEKRI
ncbi:MAG: hypothetical protein ACFFDT_15550 [Candidatus Hodarchaeota archaeon]